MTRVLFGLAAAALLSACSHMGHEGHHGMGGMGRESAVAPLAAKSGTNTQGTVTFSQHGDEVMVRAEVTGLPPNSVHGFHVHEKGDCSAPDAMSAGGHFNPAGKPHGSISTADHHAGDMPNLTADGNGRAMAMFRMTGVTLSPGPNSLAGRAVVVHKDPDDYQTQPTGNSGGRIACGVIAKS